MRFPHRPYLFLLAMLAVSLDHTAQARENSHAAHVLIAQAGSTGGTIGKQGKSASGEEAAPSPQPQNSRPRVSRPPEQQRQKTVSPCGNFAGVWRWYNNVEVVIRADGSVGASNGDSGRWTCAEGHVVINWRIAQDRVTLSRDGKLLTGTNMIGSPISNARK